jgi:hypothetical protein
MERSYQRAEIIMSVSCGTQVWSFPTTAIFDIEEMEGMTAFFNCDMPWTSKSYLKCTDNMI